MMIRTSRPNRTVPDSGASWPASTRNNVDLPVPFRPSMQMRWPLCISSERSSTAKELVPSISAGGAVEEPFPSIWMFTFG